MIPKNNLSRMVAKILPPLLLLLFMSGVAWQLIKMRPNPTAKEIIQKIPFVEVIEVKKEKLPSNLISFGTVRPRTQTTLIAEVSGIIEAVAPFTEKNSSSVVNNSPHSFRAGGFFKKGDLLLKIEDTHLKTAIAEARANLRRYELLLIQEKEMAKQARIEWGDRNWNNASDLVKRTPQIQKAEAEMVAAVARLNQAEKDLSRSEVRAPFEGRILRTMVDVGQQVGSGSSAALAEIYALGSAEIDLSLSRSEIDFLGFKDGQMQNSPSTISVHVLSEDNQVVHSGILDRSEGVVDSRTRLTKLVATVQECFANPFTTKINDYGLEVGQFVKLRLFGNESEVFVVPDSAFRDHNTLLVVDDEKRLFSRKVDVIHRFDQEVWVENGLVSGELVCTTPIEIVAEGMEVKIAENFSESNSTSP